MQARVLLISPVRNEADHFAIVARALAAQSVPPAQWIVVDDDSDDGTYEIARSLQSELQFMDVVSAPQRSDAGSCADRIAMAAPPRVFNVGLRRVDWRSFTHIGKLDGDVELPPDHLEQVLGEFARDPTLGLAGGQLTELSGLSWKRVRIPNSHVHGSFKLYSRECFDTIGGIHERLAWDTIDGVYARMNGFATRSLPTVARHHRRTGSRGGILRSRARHGTCAYITHYTIVFVLLRSAKWATMKPYGLSGIAFLWGYLRAAVTRTDRVDDDLFRQFLQSELRQRLLHALVPRRHGTYERIERDAQ